MICKFDIILTIIISSFISNTIVKFNNNKYENLYKDINDISLTAIVTSNKKEEEYYDRYKIHINEGKLKNTNLYINVSKNKKIEYGDKVAIKGTFIEPSKKRNYKGFDYKEYLKTLKIYGTVKIKEIEVMETNKANLLMQTSNKIFLKIKDNIKNTYSEKMSKIIMGIMLGYTDEIDDNTKLDFSNSNISHVLAISGMHISYIIMVVTTTTQKFIGKRKSKIIASIVLIIYMFITGFSVSLFLYTTNDIHVRIPIILALTTDTLNPVINI